jgi:pyrroline-5-carboxylate reductase
LSTTKLAFVGAGNMNSAIIEGLLIAGETPSSISVSNRSATKLERLNELGVATSTSNVEACDQADIVVLGVKPAQILDVCREVQASVARSNALVLSVAAGVTVAQLEQVLGSNTPIVRAMPNTPSTVGAGAAGLFANAAVSAKGKADAQRVLEACGIATWVESEDLIDAVIAVAGSAPAYFFYILEALVEEGINLGLAPEQAQTLAVQTCFGAAKLCQNAETDLATLRNKVTSPGGTTQAALATFKELNLQGTIKAGMRAAVARAREMAQENG